MTLEDRANLVAQHATRLGIYMHGAALSEDRDDKRALLARGFQCFRALVRQANELERHAPNCAAEGYAEADKIQDFVEGRVG